MCVIGKGAESTTGQKVQKEQLCNTPVEAQIGMLGNAPDRIAGHKHGSAFGGAGVPSTFDIRVSGSRWLTSCKPPRLQPSASPAMAPAHFMSHGQASPPAPVSTI